MAPEPDSKPRKSTSYYLRRLVELARGEWKPLALATVFLAFSSGASLLYPQAIRVILDEAIGAKNSDLIDKAALAMGAVFIVQGDRRGAAVLPVYGDRRADPGQPADVPLPADHGSGGGVL